MRTFNILLLVGSSLFVTGCGDDVVAMDMAPPDLSTPDLKPLPDLSKPDFAGVACGQSTCGANQDCCAQVIGGGGVQAMCMPVGTCVDGGATIACDGPEDCSGGTGECCTTLDIMFSTTDGGPPPSGGGDASCVGAGKCVGQVVANFSAGTATVHTRLCHFTADCANLNGTISLGTGGGTSSAFGSCCSSTQIPGFQFCAPAPSQLTAGLYTCQP
jgi:hypothetical protein